MLVADPTAQIALVGEIEPNRDQHRPARRRGLHQLRVLERGRAAAIRDRRESLGVCGPFSGGGRLCPAANLGVELLAVFAPDSVVHRPAIL